MCSFPVLPYKIGKTGFWPRKVRNFLLRPTLKNPAIRRTGSQYPWVNVLFLWVSPRRVVVPFLLPPPSPWREGKSTCNFPPCSSAWGEEKVLQRSTTFVRAKEGRERYCNVPLHSSAPRRGGKSIATFHHVRPRQGGEEKVLQRSTMFVRAKEGRKR